MYIYMDKYIYTYIHIYIRLYMLIMEEQVFWFLPPTIISEEDIIEEE